MTFASAPAAIVVDASVAVEFLGDDPALIDRWKGWAESGAMLLAPAHFPAETANALLRSQRLSAVATAARLDHLFASGVELADRGHRGLVEAVYLANKHGLTVYDALYLQLALDIDGELATLDTDLRRAATAEGLTVI
jgi:predicted nucleic acid-binding protein